MISTSPTVDRVVLRLPAATPPAAREASRQRVSRTLTQADLTPRGLPPQAILIVRRLADPQPRALSTRASWREGERWAVHARTSLEAHWRAASRPAKEAVPASAAAVWFVDRAEWLACLSLDLHRGEQRWWWQAWLDDRILGPEPMAGSSSTLARLWRAEAQWLPAALALLHEWPAIDPDPLAASLSPLESASVRRALVAAHSLPMALTDVEPKICESFIPGGSNAFAPNTPATQLLTLALLTHYAPAVARTLSASQGSRRSPSAVSSARDPLPHPTVIQEHAFNESANSDTLHTSTATTITDRPSNLYTDPLGPAPLSFGRGAGGEVQPSRSTLDDPDHPPTQPTDLPPPSSSTLPPTDTAPPDHLTLQDTLEQGIPTSLGGIWYLVNLILSLGLLADNSDAEPINPWHLLHTVAHHLLDGDPPDPVWSILTDLGTLPSPSGGGVPLSPSPLSAIYAWLTDAEIPADALHGILTQPATLYVTRTHVDVVFRLEQINLAVRLAGLDRNPGWVPEFGRVFTFHFY